MKLPPLPEPDGYMRHTPVWAEESMRAYGDACARAALEEAARKCDDEADALSEAHIDTGNGAYHKSALGVECLAAAIRAIEVKQ